MSSAFLAIVFGLLGGLAVGLQAPLSSLMSQRLGMFESIFIVHLGGAVLAAVPLLVLGGGQLGQWRNVPPYALGAGALGLVILAAVSYCMPRLGVAATVTLIITAQLVLGALLDHFGLLGGSARGLTPAQGCGMALLFLGTWLMLHK